MTEDEIRQAMVKWGKSLFERGLTSGSSGNFSARLSDGYLATPTNSCLGFLDADRLSRLDAEGRHIGGDKPTKEIPLHLAFYRARPSANGVVHLHSTFATALSCLSRIDPVDAVRPLTPYVVMRVGKVPLVPFVLPGSSEVGEIEAAAREHAAVLIANHGPVVSGSDFEQAVFASEELEEAAKVAILLSGQEIRALSPEVVAALGALRIG